MMNSHQRLISLPGGSAMLGYAIAFFVVALVAALIGYGGLARRDLARRGHGAR